MLLSLHLINFYCTCRLFSQFQNHQVFLLHLLLSNMLKICMLKTQCYWSISKIGQHSQLQACPVYIVNKPLTILHILLFGVA